MKKIISMLLALMLICTFCVPAFAAEDEPIEVEIGPDNSVCIEDGKSYIISKTCGINNLEIKSGKLTIAQGVSVIVAKQFYGDKSAQVDVWGNLTISLLASCTPNCKFTVFCNGALSCTPTKLKQIEALNYVEHDFHNGVCTACGYACENPFHSGTCPDCGMVVGTSATGSILSQGYPEIVYGIGGLAVGFIAAMLIFRKKKVAVSSTSTDDEE